MEPLILGLPKSRTPTHTLCMTQVGALTTNNTFVAFICKLLLYSMHVCTIAAISIVYVFPLRVKNKPYSGVAKTCIYSWTGHVHEQASLNLV
jgi:hypothetical protein